MESSRLFLKERVPSGIVKQRPSLLPLAILSLASTQTVETRETKGVKMINAHGQRLT